MVLLKLKNAKTIKEIASNLNNDFINIQKQDVKDIITELKNNGALNASITGKGPTVFGIFETKQKAAEAYEKLKDKYRIAVFKGDLTTTIDAKRIGRHGVQVITINTGRECHLDANVIGWALKRINLGDIDLLIIENVGNLICPAEFPLGTEKRVVVVSVTEGPYMIVKHPFTFMNADVMVINKKDLAETMKINPIQLEKQAKAIKPDVKVTFTNALNGEGIEELIKALEL